MANDLSVKQNTQLADWQLEPSKVALLKSMIAPDTTDNELELAIYVCKRTGLDPFARQIYFVKRNSGGKKVMVSQTSIDGFRLIADRTGHSAGQDDYLFDEGLTLYQHITGTPERAKRIQPTTATVTVYKMVGGVRCPYTATASWKQYSVTGEGGFMWVKMPHLMLGKCAEALALRKAFPAELSGIYTGDEMAQADRVVPNNIPFEDQMAKEKERLAKKELAKAGVIDAEFIPGNTEKTEGYVPIPLKEKESSDVPAEASETPFDQMTELQKQNNMIVMGQIMYPDSADCANYFIKSSEYFHKEEGKPDKFVKGKDNPYNLKAGRLSNTYKRIKKDYDTWKDKEAEEEINPIPGIDTEH